MPSGNSLVLGSGDFGRAYLAEGWATRLIQQLLEERTVVLVGYTVNDPPVRYLLEGLKVAGGDARHLYAFDRGPPAEIEAKWSDLGARGIAFETFEDLWNSLDEWARRSKDLATWTSEMMALAAQSPRLLKPHQRGQIANFIKTLDGAKAFNKANVPPSSEWLCVFDKNVRLLRPEVVYRSQEKGLIDPAQLYGWDDDPLPKPRNDNTDFPIDRDPFRSQIGDAANLDTRINGRGMGSGALPPRLGHLSAWVSNVVGEPIGLWWAARQTGFHPIIKRRIESSLIQKGAYSPPTQRALSLLLESFSDAEEAREGQRWYQVRMKYQVEGFSPHVMRLFEAAVRPFLTVNHPSLRQLENIIVGATAEVPFDFELHGAGRYDALEIPDDRVREFVRFLSRALERATSLVSEPLLPAISVEVPAIEPEPRLSGGELEHEGIASDFLLTVNLLRRLATIAPRDARDEIMVWPATALFFDKLRLFTWTLPSVFTSPEVCRFVKSLDPAAFWNRSDRRELAHLVRHHWSRWSQTERDSIEAIIIEGPKAEPDEEVERLDAGLMLGWLKSQGCRLSEAGEAALELWRSTTIWEETWIEGFDRDNESHGGIIRSDTDPGDLPDLPLASIASRLDELSGRDWGEMIDKKPFSGLLAVRPLKAISFLRRQARRGQFPIRHWATLFNDWPIDASPRLAKLAAYTVFVLPDIDLAELRHPLARWMQSQLKKVDAAIPGTFLTLWDKFFKRLAALEIAKPERPFSRTYVDESTPTRQFGNLEIAVNSTMGRLVRTLIEYYGTPTANVRALPPPFLARLAQCFNGTDDHVGQAVAIMGRSLRFLHHYAPSWVKIRLVPRLNPRDPCATWIWSGFLSDAGIPQPALFKLVKPWFLDLFETRPEWAFGKKEQSILAYRAIVAGIRGKTNTAYFSSDETRELLRGLNDEGRNSALHQLRTWLKNKGEWQRVGRWFFTVVWPQEVRFQTRQTTGTMLSIGEDQLEHFEAFIEVVWDYLRPVKFSALHGLNQKRTIRGRNESFAQAYPELTLKLLSRLISSDSPDYSDYLKKALLSIGTQMPELKLTLAYRALLKMTDD